MVSNEAQGGSPLGIRRTVVVGLLVIAVFTERPLFAAQQHGDARAEARLHFERGVALAKSGQYVNAIAAFNQAYSVSPHFAVLFNLGHAYGAAGEPVLAADTLRRYLSEGGAQVLPPRRSQVEADIARYEKKIAYLTFRSHIAGALIRIDHAEVGRTPLPGPVRVAPGVHVVTVELGGYRRSTHQLTVAPGEYRDVHVRLEPDAATVAAPAQIPAGDLKDFQTAAQPMSSMGRALPTVPAGSGAQARAGGSPTFVGPQADSAGTSTSTSMTQHGASRWLPGLLVLGTGIVAAGSATGIFIWNYGRQRDYEQKAAPYKDEPAPAEVANALNAEAESITRASYFNIALAIGSAALVTTGIILLWQTPSTDHRREAYGSPVNVVIGPRIVGLRARF